MGFKLSAIPVILKKQKLIMKLLELTKRIMKLPSLFNNRVDKDMIVDYTITSDTIQIGIKRWGKYYTEIHDTITYLNKYDNER
jgi:hypothetical protein